MKKILTITLLFCATLAGAQSNSFSWIKQATYIASGTNTYTLTIPNYTANTIGTEVKVLFTNGNTGASTLQIGALAAVTLRKNGSSALSSGDILPGATYRLTYDGTYFQVLGIGGSGGGSTTWASITGKPDLVYKAGNGLEIVSGDSVIFNGGVIVVDSVKLIPNHFFSILHNNSLFSPSSLRIDSVSFYSYLLESGGGSKTYSTTWSGEYGESILHYGPSSQYLRESGLNIPGFTNGNKETIDIFGSGLNAQRYFHSTSQDMDFELPITGQYASYNAGLYGLAYSVTDDGIGTYFNMYRDSIVFDKDGFRKLTITEDIDLYDTLRLNAEPANSDASSHILLRDPTSKEVEKLGIGSGLSVSGGNLVATGSGATNLSFTGSATNGTVNSDTGTDATIPLGNGTNSGLSLNDYTTAEKSKLAGITGTNTGDQTSIVGITGTKAQFNTAVTDGDFLYVGDVTSNATHTGDVTGATALTIANDAVTNEKAANMAVNTIKGRITAGTGDPEDLTATQVRTITETETTTQLNTRDTNNRNRANHTGTQLSDALYGSVSDPSRTVTANDAIIQADNGRIIYFDDTDPIVFLIDILTVDTQVALMNIGTGDVSIQSGTATVTTTVLSEGESALIVYQTTTNPIIQTSGAGGSGDVSSIETTSVDGEVVVFDGTTGKAVKRNDGTAKFPIVGLAATTFGANEVPYSSGTGNTLASSSSFNYDGTSLDAPEFNGVALTDAGDGNSVLRNDGTYGTVPSTRKNALTIETDFYNETSPYAQGLTGTAISGGTDNVIAGEPNHPGIIDIRDGTTANGGWMVQTASNAIRIAGGERLVVTFQIRNARSTANGWIGLKDNTTNAQPTDGAYVYFVGNGTTVTMDARTRNNSTETINGTTWAPTLNTWYSLVITVNSDATSVNYEVFNDAGTSQWNVNNTTNIPTGSGRETGIGAQANESTTDAAAAIMYLDYFRFEINRTLTR